MTHRTLLPQQTGAATHQYPINLELAGRRVLLVGAGNVGTQKIRSMIGAGAHVTVIAPQISDEIRNSYSAEQVTLHEREYRTGDVDGHWLVLTCTDQRDVNRHVFLDAEEVGVWSNSADDPANCAWTLPSVARQGDLQLTISTRGKSPALSMWLRRRFEKEFDERWSELLDVLAEVRAEARSTLGTSEIRGWTDALDSGAFELVMAGDPERARHHLRRVLGLDATALQEPAALEGAQA